MMRGRLVVAAALAAGILAPVVAAEGADSSPAIPHDSKPPTAPAHLQALEYGTTRIVVRWAPSSDNVGVAGYRLYRDGVKIGSTKGRTYSFRNLSCSRSYTLGVVAYDAAGNSSPRSSVTHVTYACRPAETTSAAPSAAGYFSLQPVGSWSSLPGDAQCASEVHRSSWEPRPLNGRANHVVPNPAIVRAQFAAAPRGTGGAYSPHWDGWLLPRVDGNYVGPTDEIIQWAACKWGVPDNILRAQAVRESTWFQYLTYRSGRCYVDYSCGDIVPSSSSASKVYCMFLAGYGYAYQTQFGPGRCPETFGIIGVMSWEAPSWGRMPNNQNGTFPFNRDSTAFALDYEASQLRGCYEGWEPWLDGTGSGSYSAGDIWGCVGAWYSGDWHSAAANGYISRVKNEIANLTWLRSSFYTEVPSCSKTYGCPVEPGYP